jgi:hypothetical protein
MSNESSYYIQYKEKPFEKTSYLSQVYNVLTGYEKESRLTLVFFTNGQNLESIKKSIESFYKTFKCNTIPTLVCHYGTQESIDELSLVPLFEDAMFLKYKSFSEAFYHVTLEYVKTPYMFILQDKWSFNKETIFHPLSYILDILDKNPKTINSLRFNSRQNSVNEIDKKVESTEFLTDPNIVYTSGINNEPQILNVRHTIKFKIPFVNKDMKEDGVADQLRKKYNNLTIAMKLKSCLYGSLNYPPTSL